MRGRAILVRVFVLCLVNSQVMGQTEFKDGQIHNINYEINDDVRVDYQSTGMQTTINWLQGANMPYGYSYYFQAYEDSRINVSGGIIGTLLSAEDRTQVSISGGSLGTVSIFDNSHLDVSGGSMANVTFSDNTQVDFSGGSMSSLSTGDNSWLDMSGGSISGRLQAHNTSQVNITGGVLGENLCAYFDSQVSISGGTIADKLIGSQDGIFEIYGSNFAVDGQPVGYGELTSVYGGFWTNEPYRHLTGTLAMGEPIDNVFLLGQSAKIVLVPEPATILLLGLGAVMLRRKR